MKQYIPQGSKLYNEIYDFLKERLDIPDGAQSFTMHFGLNEVLKISNMNYFPKGEDSRNIKSNECFDGICKKQKTDELWLAAKNREITKLLNIIDEQDEEIKMSSFSSSLRLKIHRLKEEERFKGLEILRLYDENILNAKEIKSLKHEKEVICNANNSQAREIQDLKDRLSKITELLNIK